MRAATKIAGVHPTFPIFPRVAYRWLLIASMLTVWAAIADKQGLLWDGMVSILRLYSPEQMKELTEDLQAPDYAWEIGRIQVRGIPGGLPYLIGRPIP